MEKSKLFNSYQNQTHPTFTYSKLTIETLQQIVKYVQSYQQRNQNDTMVNMVNFEHISTLVLVFLLLTLNEHVIAGEEPRYFRQLADFANQ